MKYLNFSFLFSIILLLLFSCTNKKYIYPIWVDEIPQGQIFNLYGSPEKNKSFGGDSLRIKNITFEHGFGTHAPSDLKIFIDYRDVIFEAIIGIDSKIKAYRDIEILRDIETFPPYIYDGNGDILDFNQGGTAVFRVYADDKMIYESPVLDKNSNPLKVRLKIKNTRNIRLVTDPYNDGSFADHTNWAMARLIFIEDLHPASLYVDSTPTQIMHNQAGYKPGSYKKCVMPADIIDSLYIFNYHTNELVFKSTIDLISEDLGKYLTADFTELKDTGTYYLSSAGRRSGKFEINNTILKNQLQSYLCFVKMMRISNKDSAGDNNIASENIRDTVKTQAHSGVFRDWGNPCRPISASVQLLHALSVIKELNTQEMIDSLVMEEIRFGNLFFHSMQAPSGYLMSISDLDYNQGNRDCRQTGISANENKPDYKTSPAKIYNQFLYTMTQARLARLLLNDKESSQKCFRSAEECFKWADINFTGRDAGSLGTAIGAACELYNHRKNSVYKKTAAKYVAELMSLADTAGIKPFGFFKTSLSDASPLIEDDGCPVIWPIAGLCLYVKTFPEDKLVNECKNLIGNYCFNYLIKISRKNAYDLIPYGLCNIKKEGSRIVDDYYYQLFNHDKNYSYPGKGTISHITSTAAGLIMAADILNKPELINTAQRQLDWVFGCNPFNLSFVTGIGYQHPPLYGTRDINGSAYTLEGGVMAGISSDIHDSPAVFPGWKETTEYLIESVANTMWLTVLLDR